MNRRDQMDDFELPDDLPQNPTPEELRREWAEADADLRELDLFLAELRGRRKVLEQLARQEQLAARCRLWPF